MRSPSFLSRFQSVLSWSARVGWVVTAVAVSQAMNPLDSGVTATFTLWILWIVGAVAVFVGSPLMLTLARTTLPLGPVAATGVLFAGGDVALGTLGLVAGVIAAFAMLSAELGQRWVQFAAYGSEQRFPLRPPLGFMIPAVFLWMLMAACGTSAVIAAERAQWVAAVALGVGAIALGALGSTRWHRLSCRWLVFVPAGVVIHDPLVLLETAMWRSHVVSDIELASAGTKAADLTGPATGPALEISLRSSETVIMSAGRSVPEGQAIHLTAALVAPSRPGAALAQFRAPR